MHREVVPTEKKWSLQPGAHEHFLFEGIEYPTTRQDLIDYATDAELDGDTLNLVHSLPTRDYRNRDDIWRAIAETRNPAYIASPPSTSMQRPLK